MSEKRGRLELGKNAWDYPFAKWWASGGARAFFGSDQHRVIVSLTETGTEAIPRDKWAEIVAHLGVEAPAATALPAPDRLFADLQAAWNAGAPLPDGKTVPAGSVPIRKNADGAYRVHPKPAFSFTVEHGERWRIAGPVPDLALSTAKAVTACTPHNKSRRVFYRPSNGHKGWWTAFGEEYEPGELLEVKEIEL
ncbi:hypothetical protein ACUIAC_00955 [Dermabacteraceae bacterium P13138]